MGESNDKIPQLKQIINEFKRNLCEHGMCLQRTLSKDFFPSAFLKGDITNVFRQK